MTQQHANGTAVKLNGTAQASGLRILVVDDSATIRRSAESMLAAEGPARWLMRKLQRYNVSIHKSEADKMLEQGGLTLPMPGLYVQVNAENLYDPMLGLKLDDDIYNPGGFTV